MTEIHVVGVGMEGAAGLADPIRRLIHQATLLVGSDRHLSYFPDYQGHRLLLTNLSQVINTLQPYRESLEKRTSALIVILTSGDPLFFGLGRLLLQVFLAEQLVFHPHLSSVQLAFSRVKLPWQDAAVISAHGRSMDQLIQALQQGTEKIAVLTDGLNTPLAIAQLLQSLALPASYQLWVCENLGGADERVLGPYLSDAIDLLSQETIAPLNVVVLQQIPDHSLSFMLKNLPQFGLADQLFLSFPDRPGLMTKREVRVQILSELALQPGQIVWDVGAGTGSVSIEIARLCPDSTIYAIEKTAIGVALIQQNCQRFQVDSVISVTGAAPDALHNLPDPDRVFVGGSGGNLQTILELCAERLLTEGVMVLALATLEHTNEALTWLKQTEEWQSHLLQVQLARSVAIGHLSRWHPLNPVTLLVLQKRGTNPPRML
ncbi:MAG: precorrin-6y C5,15-methyltransferase (decarboxylating) subunit CbiE [Leptolyngbyaceae cyanobacterium]